MLKQLLVAVSAWSAVSAFALTPVGTVIFSDSFDAYTLGENRTVLGNGWRITSGSLNVIGEGGFDPWPGNGRYLDLRGTTGSPVTLSRTFEIDTAGFYAITWDFAGSPRGNHAAVRFSTGPASAPMEPLPSSTSRPTCRSRITESCRRASGRPGPSS